MENLNISDASPQGGTSSPFPGAPPQPQAPSQLPPQMFTTAAQLLDLTDKKLMVVLRDGRKLIGVLRSWDQFANLVLQSTTERIFASKPGSGPDAPEGYFADIEHGVFLVRGENVLLLGEIDLDRDDDLPPGFMPAELDMVKKLAADKKNLDRSKEKRRLRKLATMGFEGENLGDVAF